MRSLEKNKQTIYYSKYLEKVSIIDEDGFLTGESKVKYSEPKEFKICVSPAKGEKEVDFFGDNVVYDKIMTTSNTACSINENSILWIDNLDIKQPHDYIVKRVAKSINGISYAIESVKVS